MQRAWRERSPESRIKLAREALEKVLGSWNTRKIVTNASSINQSTPLLNLHSVCLLRILKTRQRCCFSLRRNARQLRKLKKC